MVEKILRKKRDKLEPIYLVYSQEEILLENFLKKYLERFVPKEERAFNLHILDLEERWFNRVENMASTLPVMAPFRQLILKCSSMRGDDWKEFATYLPRLPETTRILFLYCGDVDGRLKFVQMMKNRGGLFPIKLSQGKKLRDMIERKFQEEEITISPEAITLLETSFSKDLGRLGQEINKALLYFHGVKRVEARHLKEIISHDGILADTAIFELVDYIGQRKIGPAMKLLQEMLIKGESEVYILTMIARQFRLILLSKDLSQEEASFTKIAKRLGEHSFPIKKALMQSKNFTFSQLERILIRIYEANLHIVTGRFKASLALEILFFDLKEMGA